MSRQSVLQILTEVQSVMKDLVQLLDRHHLVLSHKNLSEILSKAIECKASQVLTRELGYEVRSARRDKEPDLYFTRTETPLEVKVTSTDTAWTGGEFSKRPSLYMLVSWDPNSEFSGFFVALADVTESDWESRMQQGSDYYGPRFSAATLLQKRNITILYGRLQQTNRGTVKIVRDRLTQERLS